MSNWTEHKWKLIEKDGDLYAGDVKLTDKEWHREYLGQWVDPTPGPFAKLTKATKPTGASFTYGVDHGSEPSVGVVVGKCASCDVMFQGETDDSVLTLLSQHREVCPKRPLEVGDYVRWDGQMPDGSAPTDEPEPRWIEGDILEFDRNATRVRVMARSDEQFAESVYLFGNVLRRIPRPVAEVKAIHERSDGNLYYGDMKVTDGPFVSRPETPSQATVTYDGLTAEQCLERFQLQQRDEPDPDDSWGCSRPKLKPAQLAAARELWSLQLRQRVAETDAAAKERDRLQVVIDDGEVGPW